MFGLVAGGKSEERGAGEEDEAEEEEEEVRQLLPPLFRPRASETGLRRASYCARRGLPIARTDAPARPSSCSSPATAPTALSTLLPAAAPPHRRRARAVHQTSWWRGLGVLCPGSVAPSSLAATARALKTTARAHGSRERRRQTNMEPKKKGWCGCISLKGAPQFCCSAAG